MGYYDGAMWRRFKAYGVLSHSQKVGFPVATPEVHLPGLYSSTVYPLYFPSGICRVDSAFGIVTHLTSMSTSEVDIKACATLCIH